MATGASSNSHSILPIENNATNTTETSGDIELSAYGVSGYVILELRKDTTFTA
jgi:hypothetical protein